MQRLRPGDWVRVRPLSEILNTLDAQGTLDNLPFMPEMVGFCENTFRVAKRVEKTCAAGLQRRMHNAFHLEGLRCDGGSHDGCQVSCLLFWRQEWLTPVTGPVAGQADLKLQRLMGHGDVIRQRLRTRSASDQTYVCQATALKQASVPLRISDFRQYLREIRAGNVHWAEIKHLLAWLWVWPKWRLFRYTSNHLSTAASCAETVAAGDLVEIKSAREILGTLTRRGTHHGLAFNAEMLMFCGKRVRVRDNVQRMIEERSGRMKILKNGCAILDSVTCRGNCTLCPRANFHFWRHEWLTKIREQ